MKIAPIEYGDRKVYTVAAFNRGVADWLARLPTLWVEGEVTELRRRLQALVAETDSERATLETRLSELSRRVDELLARSRERLGAGAG